MGHRHHGEAQRNVISDEDIHFHADIFSEEAGDAVHIPVNLADHKVDSATPSSLSCAGKSVTR